jgi:hypothetical protein
LLSQNNTANHHHIFEENSLPTNEEWLYPRWVWDPASFDFLQTQVMVSDILVEEFPNLWRFLWPMLVCHAQSERTRCDWSSTSWSILEIFSSKRFELYEPIIDRFSRQTLFLINRLKLFVKFQSPFCCV